MYGQPIIPGLDHCVSQLDTCGSIGPNALWEEVGQHEMILVTHEIQHHIRRRECAVHHRGYLRGIHAEPSVAPAVYRATRLKKEMRTLKYDACRVTLSRFQFNAC